MNTSQSINELAAALSKAQGEITGALKDSANPFFKSKYADLASCWDACRGPLAKHGLAVFQAPETSEAGLVLITTLAHSSGQWMRSSLGVNPKDNTPQAMGSAITYARRYALTAIVGIAQIDDDGNAASGKHPAYEEPHNPRGDMGKGIDREAAEKASVTMREILEADVEEEVKALHVADRHDALNKNHDLYVAAADCLQAKERSAWKQYLKMAKAIQDKPMANGRAA